MRADLLTIPVRYTACGRYVLVEIAPAHAWGSTFALDIDELAESQGDATSE